MGPVDRDPLERGLRDLLTDDRLALPPHLVDVAALHTGAARRRRRRAAAAVTAGVTGVLLLGLAGAGLGLGRGGAEDAPPAQPPNGPAPTSAPATGAPTVSAAPDPGTSRGPSGAAPAYAWGAARPVSVTATSTDTVVVLGLGGGTGRCPAAGCPRLAVSRDGGRTFTALPVPSPGAGGESPGWPGSRSATGVRFGSGQDGWLFGGGLWSTHDAGATWRAVLMPGPVSRLEAAAGTAWALVGSGRNETLWSSPVASDDWRPVPGVRVSGPADLAVQGERVLVLGAGRSPGWSNTSGSFARVTNPCVGSLEVRLSWSTSRWATCVTGTAAYLATSGDGRSWTTVAPDSGQGALPNSVTVGARTLDEAVVGFDPEQPLVRLSSDGSLTSVRRVPATGLAVGYVGFTTPAVGYATVGDQLWRTDDGAQTWTRLDVRTQ